MNENIGHQSAAAESNCEHQHQQRQVLGSLINVLNITNAATNNQNTLQQNTTTLNENNNQRTNFETSTNQLSLNKTNNNNNKQHKLKQRFNVIRRLGKGTYGKVQLAVNKQTGQEVAIKTIKKTKIETEQDLQRVRREIQIMSSIEHPHIIHIYEVSENKDKIVLVMQYASGGELFEHVSSAAALSDDEARRLFRQIATAIYYCHSNKICHRDLKLENILLDEKSNAKLADFGLSNVFDSTRSLRTFCGSPLYASPEIVQGVPYEGPEVDCWSLGVLLYTLVYGAMPFDGSNFKRLVAQISDAVYFEPEHKSSASPLIRRLLCADARKRATIVDICNDKWVNGSLSARTSLLAVAQDMASLTPVRLDLLVELAPKKIDDIDDKESVKHETKLTSELALNNSFVAVSQVDDTIKTMETGDCSESVDEATNVLLMNDGQQTANATINLANSKSQVDMDVELTVEVPFSENVENKQQFGDEQQDIDLSHQGVDTTEPKVGKNDELCTTNNCEQQQHNDNNKNNDKIDDNDNNNDNGCNNNDTNKQLQQENNKSVAADDEDKKREKKTKKVVKKRIVVVKKKKAKTKENEDASSNADSSQRPPSVASSLPTETQLTNANVDVDEQMRSEDETTSKSTSHLNQQQQQQDCGNGKVSSKRSRRSSNASLVTPGRLRIPETFIAASSDSELQQQQRSGNALNTRRLSTEKSNLIVEVSNKILASVERPTQTRTSEPDTAACKAKVAETKVEFERRASLAAESAAQVAAINGQRAKQHQNQLIQQQKQQLILQQQQQQLETGEQDSKIDATTDANNNNVTKEQKNESIQRELAKYVESLEKLRDAAQQIDNDRLNDINNENNVINLASLPEPLLTKENIESEEEREHLTFRSRVSISLSPSRTHDDSNNSRRNSALSIGDVLEDKTSTNVNDKQQQQQQQEQPSQAAIQLPAPITRSYKKITFTKDGARITETGKVYSHKENDGTIRRIERKSKVTHYLPDKSADNNIDALQHQNEQLTATTTTTTTTVVTTKDETLCPALSVEFDDSTNTFDDKQQRNNSDLSVNSKLESCNESFTNKSNFLSSTKHCLNALSRNGSNDSNSSTSSVDIFDDIFDSWTGASNMFKQRMNAAHKALLGKHFVDIDLNSNDRDPYPHQQQKQQQSLFGTLGRTRNKQSTRADQRMQTSSLLRRGESIEPFQPSPQQQQYSPQLLHTRQSSSIENSFDEYKKNARQRAQKAHQRLLSMMSDEHQLSPSESSSLSNNEQYNHKQSTGNQFKEPSFPSTMSKKTWKGSTPSLSSLSLNDNFDRIAWPLDSAPRQRNTAHLPPLPSSASATTAFRPKSPTTAQQSIGNKQRQLSLEQQIQMLRLEPNESDEVKSNRFEKFSTINSSIDRPEVCESLLRASDSFWDTCEIPDLLSSNDDLNYTPVNTNTCNNNQQRVNNWLQDTPSFASSSTSATTSTFDSNARRKARAILPTNLTAAGSSIDGSLGDFSLLPPTPMRRSVSPCRQVTDERQTIKVIHSPSASSTASSRVVSATRVQQNCLESICTQQSVQITERKASDSLLNEFVQQNRQPELSLQCIRSRQGSNSSLHETICSRPASPIVQCETVSVTKTTMISDYTQFDNQSPISRSLSNNSSVSGSGAATGVDSLLDQLRTRGYRTMINQRLEASRDDERSDNQPEAQIESVNQLANKTPCEGRSTIDSKLESIKISTESNDQLSKVGNLSTINSCTSSCELVSLGDQSSGIKQIENLSNENIAQKCKTLDSEELKQRCDNNNNTNDNNDDDDDDDDVRQARLHIKAHLERMRQTDEFLKSVKLEQQDFERQRRFDLTVSNLSMSLASQRSAMGPRYQSLRDDSLNDNCAYTSEISTRMHSAPITRAIRTEELTGGFAWPTSSNSTFTPTYHKQAPMISTSRFASVERDLRLNRNDDAFASPSMTTLTRKQFNTYNEGFDINMTKPSLRTTFEYNLPTRQLIDSNKAINHESHSEDDTAIDAEMEAYRPPAYTKRVTRASTVDTETRPSRSFKRRSDISTANTAKNSLNNNENNSTSRLSQLESRINERKRRTAELLATEQSSQSRHSSVDRKTNNFTRLKSNSFINDDKNNNKNTEIEDSESIESRIRRKSYCVKLTDDNNMQQKSSVSLEKWRDKRRASLISDSSNNSSTLLANNSFHLQQTTDRLTSIKNNNLKHNNNDEQLQKDEAQFY